jgi:hypothetical protein
MSEASGRFESQLGRQTAYETEALTEESQLHHVSSCYIFKDQLKHMKHHETLDWSLNFITGFQDCH